MKTQIGLNNGFDFLNLIVYLNLVAVLDEKWLITDSVAFYESFRFILLVTYGCCSLQLYFVKTP